MSLRVVSSDWRLGEGRIVSTFINKQLTVVSFGHAHALHAPIFLKLINTQNGIGKVFTASFSLTMQLQVLL
jgi:hypothetical protein